MDVYPVIFPAMALALGFFDTCLFPFCIRGSNVSISTQQRNGLEEFIACLVGEPLIAHDHI